MKKVKLFSILVCTAFAVIFSSCGEDTTQKDTATTENADTTTAVAKMEDPAKPSSIMVVTHRVKDFTKWKASYDQHDDMRLASGLHNYVIGRGVDDSNMVLVAVMADNVQKAKAFAADTSLKKAMQEGGVLGRPTIQIMSMQWRDTSTISPTLRSRSTYKVKNFETWRKGFESNRQLRVDNGLVDRTISFDVDDSLKVTVVMAITDPVKAKAFVNSDLVKQKMAESGVIGKPERFMFKVVQRY